MARINVAAAGNAEENINLINPRFQAEALRRIRGIDCGVLDNSFYSSANSNGLNRTSNADFMWALKATNAADITVGRGMATAYGYDIQSERDISLTVTAPSSGTKYVFIYLEWDLSNPTEAKGSLLLHDNGASANWTPQHQDNLITNTIGVYQLLLYKIAINTSGAVTSTTSWRDLGVATIGNPLRAEYAGFAEQAESANLAQNYNSSEGSIKAKFEDIEQRLAALGFKSGSIALPNGSAAVSSVTRQGNYCILTLKVDYSKTSSSGTSHAPSGINRSSGDETTSTWGNFTIPAGFRPKNSLSFYTAAYLAGPGYGDYSGHWQVVFCAINTNGNMTIQLTGGGYYTSVLQTIDLYVGYEAA